MRYVLYCSIENPIPDASEYSRKMKVLMDKHDIDATDEEGVLYAWVYSLIRSEAETEALTTICQGRSLITEESISLVTKLFQSNNS